MSALASQIGTALALISHAKTDEEKAALRKELSRLGKIQATIRAHEGSRRDIIEDEEHIDELYAIACEIL